MSTGRHARVRTSARRWRALLTLSVLSLLPASTSLTPALAMPRPVPDSTTTHVPAAHQVAAVARHVLPRFYTVRPGDTLAKIAARVYHNSKDWPSLWWVNRKLVHDPNVITARERLVLSSWHPDAPKWLMDKALAAIAPAPVATVTTASYTAPSVTPAPAAPVATGGSWQADVAAVFGSDAACADGVVMIESGGNVFATNPRSGAYGIPQALPGSKMASAGADWATNAMTQIRWMYGYIAGTYGNACNALAHDQSFGWY